MPTPASPGTDQYRCNACGRYFNTPEELSDHEAECRVAKAATHTGTEQLREQDSRPHLPKQERFQHGTKR